jgi:hypothetical protein
MLCSSILLWLRENISKELHFRLNTTKLFHYFNLLKEGRVSINRTSWSSG